MSGMMILSLMVWTTSLRRCEGGRERRERRLVRGKSGAQGRRRNEREKKALTVSSIMLKSLSKFTMLDTNDSQKLTMTAVESLSYSSMYPVQICT